MRPLVLLSVIACLLLGAGVCRAEEDQDEPQRPEVFLWDWVRGRAKFDLYTSFHEWAGDVHRGDTEKFEVGVKALALREGRASKRTALARRLVGHWLSPRIDTAQRKRVLHVLGRIGAAVGLPLLIEQSRADSVHLQDEAIRALGFFGNAPAKESYIVYGGRVRIVVLPSNHTADATWALLAALEAGRALRLPSSVPGHSPAERRQARREARSAFRERMGSLSYALGGALRSHRTEAVARQVVRALEAPGALRLSRDVVRDVLALCAHEAGVPPIASGVAEKPATVRALVAEALGWSARREAVKPLLALLADREAAVVTAAREALARLAAIVGAPPASGAAYWKHALGPDGARLDVSKAPRPEALKPGLYKLGA